MGIVVAAAAAALCTQSTRRNRTQKKKKNAEPTRKSYSKHCHHDAPSDQFFSVIGPISSAVLNSWSMVEVPGNKTRNVKSS